MRIKLQKGKQKELILKAKENKTWKELSIITGINEKHLCQNLKNEKVLLSNESYKKLSEISKMNFDKYIEKRLNDNWGKSKGGINSYGSTIKIPKIKLNENLAEFIGALLGDGNVCYYKRNKKRNVGVYCIRIAGDLIKDKEYHKYLKNICEKIFNLKTKEIITANERFFSVTSKEVVDFIISNNIKPGNKIINQSTIPKWIIQNNNLLKVCLRGLIDTDGSIHRMSKRDFNLIRINFTNHNFTLLNDTRNGFIKLGFTPSKIIKNKQFFISRQNEIKKYLKEIGFKNIKHIKRLQEFSPFL
jgi:hypothetical protein